MKKAGLNRKQIIITLLSAMLLIGALLFGIFCYKNDRETVYYNNARLIVTEDLSLVKQMFLTSDFTSYSGEHRAVLFSPEGKVLYSGKEEYTVGSIASVNEILQPDNSFYTQDSKYLRISFAVLTEEKMNGFAAFYVTRDEAVGKSSAQIIFQVFWPFGLAIVLTIFLQIYLLLNTKRKVTEPVKDILTSTNAILNGNFEVSVKHVTGKLDKPTEMEALAYNFELMRDELDNAKKREESLKRSQKEIMSCISHDLKTPISTIRAYSEGLRDGLADDHEKVLHYAQIITEKTEILSKMIQDLLEQNNAELNQLSFRMKEQYLQPFLERMQEELGKVIVYHKMHFQYENTAPNLLLSFDENRMTQVLLNLVDNAAKYGKSGGNVIFSASFHEEERLLYLSIQDDGEGIATADIPFVFDKFYRGEKSRSTSIPGSGLGLSICKYIVEQHNGTLMLKSNRDIGTKFTIMIPVTL